MEFKKPLFFLLGPTASGKTQFAISLVSKLPLEIISVDSAMVYRGMDIGTAKPTALELAKAPHHLLDICDPKESYSAGRFRDDALTLIEKIHQKGKIPLLVGGTMLYFRILQQGLATLPKADLTFRAQLEARASELGWVHLHTELTQIDAAAAARIHPNDQQRIQRALEVFSLTGKPLSVLQQEAKSPLENYEIHAFALAPKERTTLHERINKRFKQMLAAGFLEEVERLFARGDLDATLPAIRSVGYFEMWQYLAGKIDFATAQEKAMAATRQLAKRQLTWLRAWPNLTWVETDHALRDKIKWIG